MRRALCIWLPNWPAQRLRVARPELNDRQALEELAAWCHQFSPSAGVEQADAPECLFLDITGLEHLFGGEASLGERILQALGERGLAARVGIADTLGAAWAVAHWDPAACGLACPPLNPEMLIRKRLTIILPGETEAILRPLPIEALRLPEEVIELLRSLGIQRIGQLERLPRADLTLRFGPQLVERWDQATGRRAEPIPAQPLAPEWQVRQGLEYPTARQDFVELILEQLLRQLTEQLVRSGRGAMRLECSLDCQSAEPVRFSVGLFRPSASPRHLFQLVRMRLERLRLLAPVVSVAIEASLTALLERRQEELFEEGPQRHRRSLAALVDRLTSRLGGKAVLRVRFVADAQPEKAYQYDPLVSVNQAKSRGAGRLATAWDSPPRPLRLVRQPVPVAATSLLPDGPPVRFLLRGQEHRIAHAWGPERIETAWWRGPMIARDYYRVETAAGHRYWLFRCLDDGRWFVHGMFE